MRATTYYRLPPFIRGLLPARFAPNVALTLASFTAAVDDLRAIEASSRQHAHDIEADIGLLRVHANEVWQECVRAKHAAANIEHNVLGIPKPAAPRDAYGRPLTTADDIERDDAAEHARYGHSHEDCPNVDACAADGEPCACNNAVSRGDPEVA